MPDGVSEVRESDSIFDYVESTIRFFLTNYIESFVSEVDILPISPSEIDGYEKKIGVSFFLYNLSENSFMKNKEKQITYEEKNNEIKEIIKGNPITVDLNYLITPFVKEKTESISEQLLRLLIIRAFHEFPVLSGPLLDPKLIKTENYKLNFYLNSMSLEEINHLWTLFGGSTTYRASLSYKVSPVIIRPMTTDIASLVRLKKFDYRQKITENQEGN